MIEINLLPEELKAKRKKIAGMESFLLIIRLVIAILLVLHLVLFVLHIQKAMRVGILEEKWKKLQPQKKVIEDLKKQATGVSEVSDVAQQLTNQRINWSEKLNKLSLDLPAGVWFTQLQLNPKELTLRAAVVSLQKEEMALINKFIDNLKKDQGFFADCANLELGPVQSRTVGGYNVCDFSLTAPLKAR